MSWDEIHATSPVVEKVAGDRVNPTPRPYQLAGRDFLASRTRALLADEMRVGKTPQAILAAEKIGAEHVLVLCPAIAVPHWRREWMKWAPASRIDVGVMSYDTARNAWRAGDLGTTRWDVLIVDEAHFCKSPGAARTQMVYGRAGIGRQAGSIWALSGTPVTKHAAELWAMLRAFGVTDLTYDQFVHAYCTGYYDLQRREFRITGTKTSAAAEVREMLAQVMLRRTRKEVAPEMPPIGFEFLEIYPSKKVDLMPADLNWLDSDDTLSEWAESQAGSDKTNRPAVAEAKVPGLADEITFAVENNLLRQTVVFGWHKEPLQLLSWRLNKNGIDAAVINGDTSAKRREVIQKDFRDGRIKVVVANILAAGTAIDLSAANHGYFLELDWVPGNNMQAANRLVSLQKREPMTFDVATCPGTIDDRVQRVLVKRVNEINQIL